MANNVRYTAAKRREVEAARLAKLETRDRAHASVSLEDFLTLAAEFDLSTGAEFVEFHTARYLELRAKFGITGDPIPLADVDTKALYPFGWCG